MHPNAWSIMIHSHERLHRLLQVLDVELGAGRVGQLASLVSLVSTDVFCSISFLTNVESFVSVSMLFSCVCFWDTHCLSIQSIFIYSIIIYSIYIFKMINYSNYNIYTVNIQFDSLITNNYHPLPPKTQNGSSHVPSSKVKRHNPKVQVPNWLPRAAWQGWMDRWLGGLVVRIALKIWHGESGCLFLVKSGVKIDVGRC